MILLEEGDDNMSSMKKEIKNLLPEWAKKPLRSIRLKLIQIAEYQTIHAQPKRHRKALEKLRTKAHKKEKFKVAFFAIHSSVWKYDGVYQLMDKDPRSIVVVCPVVNYGKENMLAEMEKTCTLFKSKGYNVVKTYNEEDDTYLDIKKVVVPDIVFFTNSHRGLIKDEYCITNYKDILSCYVQYSFHVTHLNKAQYNQLFHNILWKAFYETELHVKMAKQYSRNGGKNVVVTGYPGTDDLNYGGRSGKDIWKNPDESLKRIIWAPHHTIDNRESLNYSNFLRYHQFMLDLAEKYRDRIQIAFKPHPLLKVKLYGHKEWGRERVDYYYRQWEELENGQLESDDYVDLFNTSDAMILDSGSFTAEYLCCGKPSLFTFSDLNVRERFNEFGKLALEQHYHAYNEADILEFIENVVLEGKDTMKEKRDTFYASYLTPPNNKTASENIYDEICKEIFK